MTTEFPKHFFIRVDLDEGAYVHGPDVFARNASKQLEGAAKELMIEMCKDYISTVLEVQGRDSSR